MIFSLKSLYYRACENQRPSTSQFNGNSSRKRVLSDRCEQESQFPRVDRSTIFITWEGCHAVVCFYFSFVCKKIPSLVLS